MKPTVPSANPADQVKIEPFPRHRNLLEDYLSLASSKRNVHILTTYDLSEFQVLWEQCRTVRRRPPSVVAYMARCLGAVIPLHPGLTAVKYGNKLITRGHVNIDVAVGASIGASDVRPLGLRLERVDEKSLAEISAELRAGVRRLRRQAPQGRDMRIADWVAAKPLWFRYSLYKIARQLPVVNRHMSDYFSNVAITSLTQSAKGRALWGLPLLPYTLGFTLGGISRKPWVVGEQVLPRYCLDVTATADHVIVDGAPFTTFMAALGTEVESGRLLPEYLDGFK